MRDGGSGTIGVAPETHLGALVFPAYELRITRRCLGEDLGMAVDVAFDDCLARPIVKAFVAKRSVNPGDGDTIGPAAGPRTLYKLRNRHRHRGATWFDHVEQVVWLCASGYHESGDPDDAYRYFAQLLREHRIEPAAADYLRLGQERRQRFRDLLPIHAARTVSIALGAPGEFVDVVLGRDLRVRVACRPDTDLTAIVVAVRANDLERRREQIYLALAAFGGLPDAPWEILDLRSAGIMTSEIGFLLYREQAS